MHALLKSHENCMQYRKPGPQVRVYERLAPLQGRHIPVFEAAGLLPNNRVFLAVRCIWCCQQDAAAFQSASQYM